MELLMENLDEELKDKPQGYITWVPVSDQVYREMGKPRMEIVVLDEVDPTLAFRRRSDPMEGGINKGEWFIGATGSVIEEIRMWKSRLQKNQEEIDTRIRQQFENE